MKLLAILKDSFREAVDTKVFYVMVGVSCLLTLLTATLTFTPKPAGEDVMKFMSYPLNQDLQNFDVRDLQSLGTRAAASGYDVVGVKTQNGEPDAPQSAFVVRLRAHHANPEEAAQTRKDPGSALERIRERFGRFDQLRIEDVADVRRVDDAHLNTTDKAAANDVYFEVTTRPTRVTARLWPHEPSLFFGAVPLTFLGSFPLALQLYFLEDTLVGGIGAWVAVLVSIVITAFFIPNMVRKGTVDLLLVRPIPRWLLLIYKYVGGLTFIFLNTAVAVGGVWLALSLRSHVWATGFLLTILVITFFFAILYSVSTLFAVLTQSPIVAILLTCLVWFVLFIAGVLFQLVEGEGNRRPGGQTQSVGIDPDGWFAKSVRAVHFALPRTKDLDHLNSVLLMRDLVTDNQISQQKINPTSIQWGESLGVSAGFVALMLGLACWRFARKDY